MAEDPQANTVPEKCPKELKELRSKRKKENHGENIPQNPVRNEREPPQKTREITQFSTFVKVWWDLQQNRLAAQDEPCGSPKRKQWHNETWMEPWWNRGGTLVERSAELPRSPKFICHRKPQKVRNPFCPEALTIAEDLKLFAIGGKHCTILGIQNCVIMFTFRFCSTVAREKAMENICLPCADSALEAGILKYRIVARPAPCLQSDLACWNWARLMETYMFHNGGKKCERSKRSIHVKSISKSRSSTQPCHCWNVSHAAISIFPFVFAGYIL